MIESGAGDLVEVTNWFGFEVIDWNGDQVVTADDTRLGESVFRAEPDFRLDTSDGAGDRCAGDCREAIAELEQLGATVLRSDPGEGHLGFSATVLADPEGGEFCVVCRRG